MREPILADLAVVETERLPLLVDTRVILRSMERPLYKLVAVG